LPALLAHSAVHRHSTLHALLAHSEMPEQLEQSAQHSLLAHSALPVDSAGHANSALRALLPHSEQPALSVMHCL